MRGFDELLAQESRKVAALGQALSVARYAKRYRVELMETLRWLEVGQVTNFEARGFAGVKTAPTSYIRGRFQFLHPERRYSCRPITISGDPRKWFEVRRLVDIPVNSPPVRCKRKSRSKPKPLEVPLEVEPKTDENDIFA